MRGLEKNRMKRDRHTDRQTYGHRDSMIELAQWADSMKIPALGWIDDIIKVSESGHKAARLNAFINAQLAIEKLLMGAKKCTTLHIGTTHEEF